jgi:hypothetical protein
MKQIYLAYSNAAKLSDIATTKGLLKTKANVVEWTQDTLKNSQNLKNSDYLFIIADPTNKDRFGRGLYEIVIEYAKLHGGSAENIYVYVERSQSQGTISNITLARLKDLEIDNSRDWKKYAKYSVDLRTTFTSLMNNSNSSKTSEIMAAVTFKVNNWVYKRDTKVGAYRTIDGYRITYLGESRTDNKKLFTINYEVGTVMNESIIRNLFFHWRFEQAWGYPIIGKEGDITIIPSLEDFQLEKWDNSWSSSNLDTATKEETTTQEPLSNLLLLG